MAPESSRDEWHRAIAVGVLSAFVPVLVMSANQGWLGWPIATTGVLVILTVLGVLMFTIGGAP